jgi:hypothetical protein
MDGSQGVGCGGRKRVGKGVEMRKEVDGDNTAWHEIAQCSDRI